MTIFLKILSRRNKINPKNLKLSLRVGGIRMSKGTQQRNTPTFMDELGGMHTFHILISHFCKARITYL